MSEEKARLCRGNVVMYIPEKDFEENWEVIDDGKNE